MKTPGLLFVATSAIVLLAVVDPQNISPEVRAKFKQLSAICQAEHNVTGAVAERLRNAQFENTSRRAKCYMNCLGEGTKMFVNGEIKVDVVRKLMGDIYSKELVEKAEEKCSGIHHNDKCEKAFKLYACYKRSGAAYI